MAHMQQMLVGAVSDIRVSADDVTEVDSGPASSGTVTTDAGAPNTTTTGGTAPITFLWEHQSTSSGTTPTLDLATAQNPIWSATVNATTNSVSTWKVTATDNGGAQATDTITITLDWEQT